MSPERKTSYDTSLTSEVTPQSVEGQSPLEIYLTEVNRYPRLTPEQQESLFRQLRAGRLLDDLRRDEMFEPFLSAGDERYTYAFQQSQTLEELAFRCNLGLVVAEARRYHRLPVMDLIQEGNMGLMRAVERHDPELGRFTSYARWWIRGAMLNAIPDLVRLLHIPKGMLRRINIVRSIEEDLYRASGKKPSEEELRQAIHTRTGLSGRAIDTVVELMRSGMGYGVSLDKTITPDDEADLYNFVPDGRVDVEQEVLRRVDVEQEAPRGIEGEEYKKRKRPSAREAAASMGKSVSTATKILRRLVQAGLLPLHPRDPRTTDETGVTEYTRNQDAMILALLQEDARLTKEQIVELLADQDKLGKRISTLTVGRSISRLVTAGLIPPRPKGRPGQLSKDGRSLDSLVEELLQKDPELRNKELVRILSAPDLIGKKIALVTIERTRLRLAARGKKIRQIKRPRKNTDGVSPRVALKRYLAEHPNEPINRSEIARQIGVSREWIRQLYDELTKE